MRTVTEVDLVSAVPDENPEQFKTRAMRAELKKIPYIEASPEIIATFNPDGLGNFVTFFHYSKSLKVFAQGGKEAQDKEDKLQTHQRLLGGKAFFENRT